MAQLVEHILGKDEVIGSIPISSSKSRRVITCRFFAFAFLTCKGSENAVE